MADEKVRDADYALFERHFPDALLNPGDAFRDEPADRYDLLGALGLCGCGRPEDAVRWLLRYLRALDWTSADPPQGVWEDIDACFPPLSRRDDPMAWLIQYWVDDRGWAEHGGSVAGQWITDKGRAALLALGWLDDQYRLEEETDAQ